MTSWTMETALWVFTLTSWRDRFTAVQLPGRDGFSFHGMTCSPSWMGNPTPRSGITWIPLCSNLQIFQQTHRLKIKVFFKETDTRAFLDKTIKPSREVSFL